VGTIFRESNFRRETEAGEATPIPGGPRLRADKGLPSPKPVGERIAPAGSIEEKLEAQAKAKRGLPPPRN
jgi:hypothetical protein